MMKKRLSVLLALALLLTLAACGGKNAEPTPDQSAKETLPVTQLTPTPPPTPVPTVPPPKVTIPPDGVVYYQIRIGSFATKEEADGELERIKELEDKIGANYAKAYVTSYSNVYTVISGTFTDEKSAQTVVDDLLEKGITSAGFKVINKEGQEIGSVLPATPTPEPTVSVTYYQVQAGSFTERSGAEALRDEIRKVEDKIGADYKSAYVTENGENYTVACGTFSLPEHAQTVVDDLAAHGYTAVVAEIQSS